MKPSAESYYDEFSHSYENKRHFGYHQMLDDLEVELSERYCSGKLLEAGCGTGLILDRLAKGHDVYGMDLSSGMLSHASQRGLRVSQASIDRLPYPDQSFDGVVSFKVLAHIPNIAATIEELARVTKPGGHLVLEFYNRYSLRYLIKQLKKPSTIGKAYDDEDVFTRFDSKADIENYLPEGITIKAIHGVRVATPFAQMISTPIIGNLLRKFEEKAKDLPLLRKFGGFMVVVLKKKSA